MLGGLDGGGGGRGRRGRKGGKNFEGEGVCVKRRCSSTNDVFDTVGAVDFESTVS